MYPPHTATAKSLIIHFQELTLPETTLCSPVIPFVLKKKKEKPSNHLMIILFGPLLLKKYLPIPRWMIVSNAEHQPWF